MRLGIGTLEEPMPSNATEIRPADQKKDFAAAGGNETQQDSSAGASPKASQSSEGQRQKPKPKKRAGLSNNALNFLVDLILLVSFLAVLWVACIVQFIFPPGTKAAGWTLWQLDYDTWCRVYSAALAAFCVQVLVHLILHWNWVCAFITSRMSKLSGRRVVMDESAKTLYGVGTLITILTILGALLTVAEFSIKEAVH